MLHSSFVLQNVQKSKRLIRNDSEMGKALPFPKRDLRSLNFPLKISFPPNKEKIMYFKKVISRWARTSGISQDGMKEIKFEVLALI